MATTPTILTQGRPSEADEVFYPETDGMPLADGHEQEPHFTDIMSTLRFHLEGSTTAVSGNTFVYYVEGDPRRWVSPDCYVAFGVDVESIRRFNNYRVWEVGKAPDFVLEIGSPSTASNDTGAKRELYASLGVKEYWRFDPTGGDHYGEPLVGEYLADGEYHRFDMSSEPDGVARGHSPLLGLDLCWQEGRLRFYDPEAGRWLENYAETATRAAAMQVARKTAESRAESAEACAAAERAARESTEARLAEMEAELRRLRGE